MIISNKNQYLFIAVPKTGTTSIEKLLLDYDPSAKRYSIQIEDKRYNFGGHDTACQIKATLGKLYSNFRTIGFIRNPYSRLVSSYFFYKNGKPITPGNKNPWPPRIKSAVAKTLPFKIWALSYPYKSNIEYFVEGNDKVIVDYIGTFERLHQDLTKIFSSIGLDIPTNRLKHANKSNHSHYLKYFANKSFKKKINKRIQRDLEFYEKYKFNL